MPTDRFFTDLPASPDQAGTFDRGSYRAAPDDWLLAVADVKDSTGAIERGGYRAVNFASASVIAALKNLCAPLEVPFLFAGDGSVVLVPPARAEEARRVLARVRGFAQREYGLLLRVGLVPVRDEATRSLSVATNRARATPSAFSWAGRWPAWRPRSRAAATLIWRPSPTSRPLSTMASRPTSTASPAAGAR